MSKCEQAYHNSGKYIIKFCWSTFHEDDFFHLDISRRIFFLAAVPSCFSADQQYEECLAHLTCGPDPTLFPNVSYPFWGVNKPNYCGQAGFQLSCKNDQNLTLALSNSSFRVLSSSLENQTLTVAEESLFNGGCPNQTLNFTGNGQFTLNPTAEIIDLFICPDSRRVNPLSSFTCGGNNEDMVTYHVFTSSQPASACRKIGEVPMLMSVKNDLLRSSQLTLEEALLKGYDLRYYMRDGESCRGCSNSGGICGSELGSEDFRCLCEDRPHSSSCFINENASFGGQGRRNIKLKIIIGVMAGGAVIILVIIILILKKVKNRSRKYQNLEALIPLKQYSYARVKQITKSFTHEIGKGGFGIVYKGNLCDGRKVAVKVLKDSKGNAEDFINEVSSMSKTSHVNIVTLLGFCYEGSKRAIIYEFLENGSLDKFIKSSTMDWNSLYGIALGVARGLEYLHNGCRERIVHFDIKPQNVLLDENLCPKVSDFGLAKLCEKKESILSLMETRGTIGYIAPEVFSKMYGRVSHKSDVYSYGMLVLEIVGATKKTSNQDCS